MEVQDAGAQNASISATASKFSDPMQELNRRLLQNGPQTARSGKKKSTHLWQLPEASAREYASWIQEKPEESQTPAEKRFLRKYQRRMLVRRQKTPTETMKNFIARLEEKPNLSDVELQLIEAYHRRKANKRSRIRANHPFHDDATLPAIFWKRLPVGSLKKSPPSSPSIMATISTLQESMNRMGLSCEKLLDIPMDEEKSPPLKAPSKPKTSELRPNSFSFWPY